MSALKAYEMTRKREVKGVQVLAYGIISHMKAEDE